MPFKFQENARVAIVEDHPTIRLKAGSVGVVWALYDIDPPMYEVTFVDDHDKKFDMNVREEEIRPAE